MTNDILYLLVTCSLEETRFSVLNQVVDNLRSLPDQTFLEHMIVFDNASTIDGSDQLLTSYFKNVIKCNENVGFWSAIRWVLNNYESIMNRQYKFLYVIESDLIHTQDAFQRLEDCERFLDENGKVGFVRIEEFDVSLRHLYDKQRPHPESRQYAWCVQNNYITRERVWFKLANEQARIYKTNFLAKIPVVSRIGVMKDIFENLSKMKSFNEMTFQKLYHDRHQQSAILDGGVFHSKLGNMPQSVLMGSYVQNGNSIGYRETRSDNIVDVKDELIKVIRSNNEKPVW